MSFTLIFYLPINQLFDYSLLLYIRMLFQKKHFDAYLN